MKRNSSGSRLDIDHLARLSNLKLSKSEKEDLRRDLESTIEYIKNLKEIDVSALKPSYQSTNLKNVSFEDGEGKGLKLTKEDALKNAAHKKDGYFIVKRVL